MNSRLYYVVDPKSGDILKEFRCYKVHEIEAFMDELCKQNRSNELTPNILSLHAFSLTNGELSPEIEIYIHTRMTKYKPPSTFPQTGMDYVNRNLEIKRLAFKFGVSPECIERIAV